MEEFESLDYGRFAKVRSELGMRAERIKDDVDVIRTWVNCQPHLPNLPDDKSTDLWLEHLLFLSKNRIEKVKKGLDEFFKCKSELPEIYKNRDPSDPGIRQNVEVLHLLHLPKLTPKGHRVHFFGHAVADFTVYDPTQTLRRAFMMWDLMQRDTPPMGEIVILDLKLSSIAHWSKYNLTLLAKCLHVGLEAYPKRVKALHFINAPSFIALIQAFMLPLMPEKIVKRVKIHHEGSIDGLLEDVPEECLPREIGGTLNLTLDEINKFWYERLLKHKDWFLADEQLKSDESKRIGNVKTNSGFGCEGTFRSLTVD